MIDPYTNPAHAEYVATGKCPAISVSKSWCNRFAGHSGPHESVYLDPPPAKTAKMVKWTREFVRMADGDTRAT